MSEGIRIEGLSRAVKALEELGVEIQDLKNAFSKISNEAASAAQSFAPKKSGRLAASIKGSKSKNRAVVKAGSVRVVYSGVQNYGWRKRSISPHHFMQRAEQAVAPSVVPTIERELSSLIHAKGF